MNAKSAEFWSLVHESGWLSEKKIASLRKQIEKKASIANSPTKIGKVLTANEVLDESQVQQLLAKLSPDDEPKSTATKPRTRVQTRKRSNLPLTLAITAALFLAIGGVVWMAVQPTDNADTVERQEDSSTRQAENDRNATDQETTESYYEFVDDEEALWARPEPGDPIQPMFAPAGVQTIVRIRLRDILRQPEGKKLLRSLGPTTQETLDGWLSKLGTDVNSIETLSLHLLPQGTTYPQVVAVAKLAESGSRESLTGFSERNSDGVSKLGADSVWFPKSHDSALIFGPTSVVTSMVDEAKSDEDFSDQVMLRRELEQLRRATHDTDHITVLANPNFLRDEAQDLFPDLRRRLLDGLYAFWSQEAQAVSLGIQLSDVSVVEVRMIAREDLPPRRLQGRVKNFMAKLPSTTSDFLGRAQLDPYWQPLALRFPSMLRFLSEQTRTQVEGKQVAINVALPVEAIHNLALATELSSVTPTAKENSNQTVDRSNWTLDDVLAHKTSIRFSQKSLEQAMRDVAQQINEELRGLPVPFAIEIVGTDLELDGITRNQQIRDFKIQDAGLAEALTALVAKANPTQNITVDQPEQKLVWIPQTDSGSILITTRSAAKAKSLPLPSVFGL